MVTFIQMNDGTQCSTTGADTQRSTTVTSTQRFTTVSVTIYHIIVRPYYLYIFELTDQMIFITSKTSISIFRSDDHSLKPSHTQLESQKLNR